ncbi:Transcription factor COE2 [Dionaea muscipula]
MLFSSPLGLFADFGCRVNESCTAGFGFTSSGVTRERDSVGCICYYFCMTTPLIMLDPSSPASMISISRVISFLQIQLSCLASCLFLFGFLASLSAWVFYFKYAALEDIWVISIDELFKCKFAFGSVWNLVFSSFPELSVAYCGALVHFSMEKLRSKFKGFVKSFGCIGCCAKPRLIVVLDEPSIQSEVVKKTSITADYWSTNPAEMENSTIKSHRSISSISNSNQNTNHHSSTSNPSEFANHGVLLWNQVRQQWVGDRRARDQTKTKTKTQEPRLSWNPTYEHLLETSNPFPQPIPLPEMVDFLTDLASLFCLFMSKFQQDLDLVDLCWSDDDKSFGGELGLGEEDFFPGGGSIYSNAKDTGLFFSLGYHADVYFPRKRARISASGVLSGERLEHNKQKQEAYSINVPPDECLFEIFRRLRGPQERSTCACVSKRWLMLLSSIHYSEGNSVLGMGGRTDQDDIECDDGFLSRSLEGKKATDVRLASIAVGAGNRGGLSKLIIRGRGCNNNPVCGGVTDIGMTAIARGCPSLKVLSLWNVSSSVGDQGLIEIANGCHRLEKLDLCSCPAVTDKALISIAEKCRDLAELTIESCLNVGNKEGMQSVGKFCPNLKSLSIKNCPLVCDQGIASVLSSSSSSRTLTKVKLQALNIGDVSLAVVGHYGRAVTDLVLASLPNVTERGFWVMGRAHGLQMLKTLSITSCSLGVTDRGLEELGKGCPNLRVCCLRKCAFLSDGGLMSFAKAVAYSVESLRLEECHRITQAGFFGLLLTTRGAKLKDLAMINCLGIKDMLPFGVTLPDSFLTSSLRSLSIRNCPGFGNMNLRLLAKMCPRLQSVDLSGLHKITDAGLLPVIWGRSCDAAAGIGLVKVNLSGSMNVTNEVVSVLMKLHGGTLEVLNLDGCGKKITDASLVAIAEDCMVINQLNLSKCAISDFGIASLARSKQQINLRILSLSGCSMVSDKSLPFLVKLGQNLLGLNLQNCNAISSIVVDMLMERLWRCDILS